ncbi:hypothetical protein [Falsiporphyromonas endometrii]|uniref:Protein BatD n=1 Tax=Falsiporphyromonas endometrii TaxID=1387297 RepID=A0ABV9K8W4_9PORP
MRRRILFLCCAIILSLNLTQQAFGQNIAITGQIDRTEIKVGEQAAINMKVRCHNIKDTRIVIPADSTQQDYTVVSYHPTDTVNLGDGNYEISAQMIITAWDSCLLTIPKIYAQIGEEKASIGPFTLKVTEPKVDISRPDSINEIKTPWNINLTFKDILSIIFESPITYIILFVLLVVAGIFIYLRIKKRKKELPIKEEVYQPTPYEIATKQLEDLRLMIGRNIDHKVFYSNLIDILRCYLVETTSIEAMEMVSSELSQAMRHIFPDQIEEIGHFDSIQTDADMAKYAKGVFQESDKRRSIEIETKLINALEAELKRRFEEKMERLRNKQSSHNSDYSNGSIRVNRKEDNQ